MLYGCLVLSCFFIWERRTCFQRVKHRIFNDLNLKTQRLRWLANNERYKSKVYPIRKFAERSVNGFWRALGYAHTWNTATSRWLCRLLNAKYWPFLPPHLLSPCACHVWPSRPQRMKQRSAQQVSAAAHAKDSTTDSRGLKWKPSPPNNTFCSHKWR